jgi:hypothetical protein
MSAKETSFEDELSAAGIDPSKWVPASPDQAPPIVNGQAPSIMTSLPLASQLPTDFVRNRRAYATDLQILGPSGQAGVGAAADNAAVNKIADALPGSTENGIVYPATLDSIANSPGAAQGNGSSKVNSTAVNANPSNGVVGAIAPAQAGVLSQGSTPFSIVTTPFTYTATTTTITISWAALPVPRGNNTTTILPLGSITITGLTAGTNYYFYPTLNDLALVGAIDYQVVRWLAYTDASNTPVGAPAIAYLAPTAILAQQSNLQHLIGLVGTYLEFATPASGSSSGSGGGDGGAGGGKGNSFV